MTPSRILDSNLEFKSFLMAFTESANRSRRIINILTITSIAALLGVFNSLKPNWNWFPSRQERIREMYQLAVFNDDTLNTHPVFVKLNDTATDTISINRFSAAEFSAFITKVIKTATPKNKPFDTLAGDSETPWIQYKVPEYLIKNDTLDAGLLIKNFEKISRGFKILATTTFASRNELNRYLQAMNRAKLENSTFVRVPILGIAFDVNWLIIISGISFWVIYFLLYYAFSRERKNIFLLFKIAEKENISPVGIYQLTSMQVVFTIPPSIDEVLDDNKHNNKVKDRWHNKVKRTFPKLSWMMPLCIWGFIFWYDSKSQVYGEVLNPALLFWQKKLSIFIGLILCYLAFLCIRESVRIDRIWKKQANHIIHDKQTDGDNLEVHDGD